LRNIRGEIAANRAALAEKMDYHEAMRDSLQTLLEGPRAAYTWPI